MDVAIMPFVADTPAPQPQKATGKSAESQSEDSGGFAAMFAGLVAAGQPAGGDGAKPAAESATAGELAPGMAPGMVPGMWNFAPLMPLMATVGQVTVPQTAQEATGAGAITPLTAAVGQATPGAQLTPVPSITADTAQQQPAVVTAQTGQTPTVVAAQAGQTPTVVTAQAGQTPGAATPAQPPPQVSPTFGTEQTAPAMPAVPMPAAAMPATQADGTAAVPAAQVEAEAVVPAAEAMSIAANDSADRPAIPVEAAQQPVTAAAITTAVASGQRLAEKPVPATVAKADANADANAPDQSLPPTTGITVTANSEASADGDNGAAFTAESFTPAVPNAAPPPETATNQVFAALVDQLAKPASPAAASVRSVPADAPPPGPDPYNVAGQIVDHARLISRAENSEMVIRLKPEHLGELTLKIVVDSGAVSATFHTASAEVRGAIEASLPQLRQDMANQGLKVDYVGVYASLDHFFANDQRHAPQQQVLPTTRRQSGDEVFTDTFAAAAAIGSQAAGGGIDYRV